MKRKAIMSFITEHRSEIDEHIRGRCSGIHFNHIRKKCDDIQKLNDRERHLWIANDESLYLWAKSEGVRL